jgi:hypothetical protein
MPQIAANPGDIELRANVWWEGQEKAYPAEAFDLSFTEIRKIMYCLIYLYEGGNHQSRASWGTG